jgi:hypothetical protein
MESLVGLTATGAVGSFLRESLEPPEEETHAGPGLSRSSGREQVYEGDRRRRFRARQRPDTY